MRLTSYGGIDAEATARTRAAAERYTFSQRSGDGHVLVNVGQANERHSVIGSVVDVVGDRVVEGKLVTKSFCGGHQYTTWFRIEFDRPFKAHGTWGEGGGLPGARHSMEGEQKPNGAWLSFDLAKGQSVTAVSAISHVDAEGARTNLRAEGMQGGALLGFDRMRALSQQAWREQLGRVRVQGGTADDRTVFYSAVYHALLQPMTGNDADGRYRGYDDGIHRADGWTYYEYFSLWDTYRAQNQWLALTRPDVARDIGRTLLAIDEQGGWLPRWGYANFETNIMTGDPVTPFMVDLWRFGALKGRESQAWDALRRNAFGTPPLNSRMAGRSGNPTYLDKGYVAYDRAFPSKGMDVDPHHGGSATLEYALADCALSQMADGLGHAQDAATLRERGRNWRKVWDRRCAMPRPASPGSRARAPRMASGTPRPTAITARVRTTVSTRARRGSTSGWRSRTCRAWSKRWMAANRRAAASMRSSRWTRCRPTRSTPRARRGGRAVQLLQPVPLQPEQRAGPAFAVAVHADRPAVEDRGRGACGAAAVHQCPNGVTGNDDLGTMSAWYLFSAIGVYPAVPGSGQFLLHTRVSARWKWTWATAEPCASTRRAPMAAACSTCRACRSMARRMHRCGWTGAACSRARACALRWMRRCRSRAGARR